MHLLYSISSIRITFPFYNASISLTVMQYYCQIITYPWSHLLIFHVIINSPFSIKNSKVIILKSCPGATIAKTLNAVVELTLTLNQKLIQSPLQTLKPYYRSRLSVAWETNKLMGTRLSQPLQILTSGQKRRKKIQEFHRDRSQLVSQEGLIVSYGLFIKCLFSMTNC